MGEQTNTHSIFAIEKIWSFEEFETLLVGTKPRTSHYQPLTLCHSDAGVGSQLLEHTNFDSYQARVGDIKWGQW